MTDQRLDLLTDWLETFFGDENFVITTASDDASFRRYFRIERDNTCFIAGAVVFSYRIHGKIGRAHV